MKQFFKLPDMYDVYDMSYDIWHVQLGFATISGCLSFQDAQLRQMLPRYAMPGEFPVLKILLEHLPSTLLPQKAWASCPENVIGFIFQGLNELILAEGTGGVIIACHEALLFCRLRVHMIGLW